MFAELQKAIVNRPQRQEINSELTDAEKIKTKIERHALMIRSAPIAIGSSVLLCVICVMVGWDSINRAVLGIWAGSVAFLAVLRLIVWYHFSRKKKSANALETFTKVNVAGMALNGVLWGSLAPIFSISGMIGHAFLPFLIAGMTAATVSSAGASWRSVMAFNIPALAPLGVTYAMTSDTAGYAIAMAVFVYMVATGYLAWNTQEMIVRSIRLRSRNAALVKAINEHLDAAQEAEARFKALVEVSKDLTIIFSPDGKVIYASPSIEAMLGILPEEIIGRSTRDIVHPDDFGLFKSVGERSLLNLGEAIPLHHVCFKDQEGRYIALAGRLTNMLYVPGVEGFVFNGGLIDESTNAHLHVAER